MDGLPAGSRERGSPLVSCAEPKKGAGGGVACHDSALGVTHDDALGERVDHRPIAGLALAERRLNGNPARHIPSRALDGDH